MISHRRSVTQRVQRELTHGSCTTDQRGSDNSAARSDRSERIARRTCREHRQDQALRRGGEGRPPLQLCGDGRRRRRQGQGRLGLRQGQRSAAQRREGPQGRHAQHGRRCRSTARRSRTWSKGRYGAAHVILLPAAPGTGVIAGAAVRAVCEAAGIHDILTKSFGSNNPVRWSRPRSPRSSNCGRKHDVERLRGVTSVMNLNDVNRGIHKNKTPQAPRPRHRLGPRQDGRPRPQGPGSRNGVSLLADLSRRQHAAGAPHSQARLQQPLGADGRRGQRRRSERSVRSGRRSHARGARGQEPGSAAASTS